MRLMLFLDGRHAGYAFPVLCRGDRCSQYGLARCSSLEIAHARFAGVMLGDVADSGAARFEGALASRAHSAGPMNPLLYWPIGESFPVL
jgi:hypothetical protein